MKLWIDDVRPAPDGWTHEFDVGAAIDLIQAMFFNKPHEEMLISLDHDSGRFYNMCGDYIKILDHLEEMGASNEFFKAGKVDRKGNEKVTYYCNIFGFCRMGAICIYNDIFVCSYIWNSYFVCK